MTKQLPRSCVELLQRMVSFNTINRMEEGIHSVEHELAACLEQLALAWNLTALRLPIADPAFNLLITHQVDSTAPWLLFDSHLDTVDVQGMTIDPFGGELRNGKIFGRGACDTKGTGAAMLWALKSAIECQQISTNVAILFCIEEEYSKTGVKEFVHRQLPELDWHPAGVIVGEPTRMRLVSGHKGTVRWNIRTRGVAAHSSNPSQGKSAIRSMMHVIDAIEKHYTAELQISHPLVGKAQCSINIIRGGSVINVIPDLCEIWLDRRVVPGEDVDAILPAVESVLNKLRAEDPDLEVEQLSPRTDRTLSPELNQELSRRVGQVLEQSGLPSEPTGAPFGTDACQYESIGLQAVVLGPGDIAKAHSADEFIEVEQLENGVDIYGQLMTQPPGFWEE